MLNTKINLLIFPAIITMVLIGCGVFVGDPDEENEDDDPKVVVNPVPPDSTGAQGTVNLQLMSSISSGMGLLWPPALLTAIPIGDDITINKAKVHVGRVKLKTSKEKTEDEIELDNELASKELEEESEDSDQEEASKIQLSEIEERYDDLIDAATTNEEKEQLEAQEDAEKEIVEDNLAEIKYQQELAVNAIEDERDQSLKWKQSFLYDLVADTVTPEIPAIQTLDGSYNRIEFKISPVRDPSADPNLINRSILIQGTALVDSQTVSFEFTLREDLVFCLKGTGALTVAPGATSDLMIAFQIANWFDGIDFGEAEIEARDTIEIDEELNKDLYEKILENIKRTASYGEDEDGDGEFEDEESEGDGNESEDEEDSSD